LRPIHAVKEIASVGALQFRGPPRSWIPLQTPFANASSCVPAFPGGDLSDL
jgi:hypothetical protein